MQKKTQFKLTKNELTLEVKKSPLIILVTLYVLSALSITLPLIGVIMGLIEGKLHILYFIFLTFFGFISYKILRIALWNTMGAEKIIFHKNYIEYTPDYKWFQEKTKVISFTSSLNFRIEQVGYEDEKTGNLIIECDQEDLICVTKINNNQLDSLISKLKKL